ncbi:helix-turn-helix domain-containing protein [Paenibacillus typhae]|uniref:helix-turn-helix domain-containing protein n=1 Tax=Paenibacillus typhae TaxID=1174501 RepID=UPI001C8ED604|nr:helix-turn-helix transcriptional regulator [Paenibacillus typhae]MBY0011464.1 helix-turn-helix transcriptional regulator [Paenibacillus typhae]
MRRAEVAKKLIEDTGLSQKAFAEKAGLPYTTLRSMLNRGFGGAAVDNVIKVTKALGITVDELERLSGSEDMGVAHDSIPLSASEIAEFEDFISNPDNNLFFKELIESPEKRIKDLRQVWEIIKGKSENE